jgi:hypothetical protein
LGLVHLATGYMASRDNELFIGDEK